MEQHPPKQRFMKIEEVSAVTTLSETQIYRKMKAGDFPQNISIGANSKVWLESEIQKWMTEQITKNRNPKGI